jgi:hypothetical protein
MPRLPGVTDADHEQAAREAAARRQLLDAGASSLPRAPWLRPDQPPSAADLIKYALWQIDSSDLGEEALLAALALLAAARTEADQAEAALMFTARARHLSWLQISRAMGLRSPQAAQQRFGRVKGRAQTQENG